MGSLEEDHLVRVLPWMFVLFVLADFTGCGRGSHHPAYVTLANDDQVIGYSIFNNTGNLRAIAGSPFATGVSPFGVVALPSKQFVYVANSGESTISLFKASGNGALKEVTPRTNVGLRPQSLTIDSSGNFLFVGSVGANTITTFSIDSGSGALAQVGVPISTESPSVLKVPSSGNFLYVANSNTSTITAYSIGSNGSLTQIAGSPFAVGNNPSSIVFDSSGSRMYVSNLGSGTFSEFKVNSSSGFLTPFAGSPFTVNTANPVVTPTTPISIALDSSGQYLYVACANSNNIFGYSVNGQGIPAEISGSPFTATAPTFLLLDSSGKFLYASDQTDKRISLYTIDTSNGSLGGPAFFGTGTAPTGMFILP